MSNIDKIYNFEKGFYRGVKKLDKTNKDRQNIKADSKLTKKKFSDIENLKELKRKQRIKNDTEEKGINFDTLV